MQSRRAGAPLVRAYAPKTDHGQRHAREHERYDGSLAPAPAQRFGQPLGLINHDHGAASVPIHDGAGVPGAAVSGYASVAAGAPASGPVSAAAPGADSGWKASAAELMQ